MNADKTKIEVDRKRGKRLFYFPVFNRRLSAFIGG